MACRIFRTSLQELLDALASKENLATFIGEFDESGTEYTLQSNEHSALFAAFDVVGPPEASALSLERFYPKKGGTHCGAHLRLGVFQLVRSPDAPHRAVERCPVRYEGGGIVIDTTRGRPNIDQFLRLCSSQGFAAAREWTSSARKSKPIVQLDEQPSESTGMGRGRGLGRGRGRGPGLFVGGQPIVGISKKKKQPPSLSFMTAVHALIDFGSPSKDTDSMDADACGSPVFAPPTTAATPPPPSLPLPLPLPPSQAAAQPAPPLPPLSVWAAPLLPAPVQKPSASAMMIEELSRFLCEELSNPSHQVEVRIVLLQILLTWHAFGLFDVFEKRTDKQTQALTVRHSGFKDAILLPTETRAQVDVIPAAAAGSSAGISGALRFAIQEAVSVSVDMVHSAYQSLLYFPIQTMDGKISPLQIQFSREHLLRPFAPNAHPASRHVAGLDVGTLLLRTMDEQSLEGHHVTYSPLAIRDFANGQSDMHLQVAIACIYGIRIERKNILGNEMPTKPMDDTHRRQAIKQHYITPLLDLAMLVASRVYEDLIAKDQTVPAVLAARDATETVLDLFGETHFELPEEKAFFMTVFRIVVDGTEEWLACRFTTTSQGVLFTCFDTAWQKRNDTARYSQQSHDELKMVSAKKANARFMQIYMAAMLLTDRLCKEGKTAKDQRLTVRVDSQVPACPSAGLSGVFAISLLTNFLSLKVNNELSGPQGAQVAWQYHRNVVQHLLPSNWDALWK